MNKTSVLLCVVCKVVPSRSEGCLRDSVLLLDQHFSNCKSKQMIQLPSWQLLGVILGLASLAFVVSNFETSIFAWATQARSHRDSALLVFSAASGHAPQQTNESGVADDAEVESAEASGEGPNPVKPVVKKVFSVPLQLAERGLVREQERERFVQFFTSDALTLKIGVNGACRRPTLWDRFDDVDCKKDGGSHNWCEKFVSEALLPVMIKHSRFFTQDVSAAAFQLAAYWSVRHGSWENDGPCFDDLTRAFPGAMANGDMFVVLTNDKAACERDGPRKFLPVPKLQNDAHSGDPVCFKPGFDVGIPTGTWHEPPLSGSTSELLHHELSAYVGANNPVPPASERTLLAFMVGDAFPQRAALINHYKDDPEVVFRKALTYNETLQQLQRAKFCIQADGNAPWSPRLAIYVALGCVPVFVSNTFIPPWNGTLDWSQFSLQMSHEGSTIIGLKQALKVADHARLFAKLMAVREFFRHDVAGDGTTGALPLIVYEMVRSRERTKGALISQWQKH